MQESNQAYLPRIEQAKLLPHAQAWQKLLLIGDLIDFDTINCICDVGSRFGEQAIELATIFPQARVHAFEPVPENYHQCLANQQAFEQPQIKFHNVALGERQALIPFYPVNNLGTEHNLGASSRYRFIEGRNGQFLGKTWFQDQIHVPMRTLDSYALAVDLIWMDAQGSELGVLEGSTTTLESVKVIMTEVGIDSYYQGQSLQPEIDKFLTDRGFRELVLARELCHEYEINTIYIRV